MEYVEILRSKVTGVLHRAGLNGQSALLGALLFLVTFFGSIALTGALLVRLPPDYLVRDPEVPPARADIRAFLRRLAQHALGVLLILIGLVLMLPGVPGQGFLTVLAGLFISELPGTRALLRRFLRGPRTLSAVNKLRARYRHPPIEAPPAPP